MSEVTFVARPTNGVRFRWKAHYEALLATLDNGQAVRVTFGRSDINNVRQCFQAKYPHLRVCSKGVTRLSNVVDMWVERRGPIAASDAVVTA